MSFEQILFWHIQIKKIRCQHFYLPLSVLLNKTVHNSTVIFFETLQGVFSTCEEIPFMTVLYAFLRPHVCRECRNPGWERGVAGEQILRESERLSTIRRSMHSSFFKYPHTHIHSLCLRCSLAVQWKICQPHMLKSVFNFFFGLWVRTNWMVVLLQSTRLSANEVLSVAAFKAMG